MSEYIAIRTRDEVQEVTPELVARLFCSMNDSQQADFFTWCAKINDEWQAEYEKRGRKGLFISGGQWYSIGRKLAERDTFDEGRAVMMDIAAPLYVHALSLLNKNQIYP